MAMTAFRSTFARHNSSRSDIASRTLSAVVAAAAAAATALTAAHAAADARRQVDTASERDLQALASKRDLQSRASSAGRRHIEDGDAATHTLAAAATDARPARIRRNKRLFEPNRCHRNERRSLINDRDDDINGPNDASQNLYNETDDKGTDDDLRKRILILTDALSGSECHLLRTEADRVLDSGLYRRDLLAEEDRDGGDRDDRNEMGDDDGDDEGALRRVSLCDTTANAQRLSNDLIFRRVLPALRCDAPELLDCLGLSDYDDDTVAKETKATTDRFDWAADEPSINRYTVGGEFDPHKDGYALTVLVQLSEDGSYQGGGTRFFESKEGANRYVDEGSDKEAVVAVASVEEQPHGEGGEHDSDDLRISRQNGSVLVKPTLGSAVLFGGDLLHAGCPVTSGVRHVYVASFSLKGD